MLPPKKRSAEGNDSSQSNVNELAKKSKETDLETELTSQEARDALCSRSSPLLMDIKEELEDMEEDVKKEVESEVDDNQTENEKKDDEDEEDGVKSGNESEKDDIVEDSLDGEESRDKSKSSAKKLPTDHVAHRSTVQYRVAAMIDEEMGARNLRECTSFLDKITTCRSIHKEFPEGATKYARYKDALAAGLVENSSSMEAAYICSQFEGELRKQILKLFDHPSLSTTVLYKEGPRIIQRAFEDDLKVWKQFFDDVTKSDAMSSEKLRKLLKNLKDKVPKRRSNTSNAARKRNSRDLKKDSSFAAKVIKGMDVKADITGSTNREKIRACVAMAVDYNEKDIKKKVKKAKQFVAFFMKQKDIKAHSEWAEFFISVGGVIFTTDLCNGVDRSVLPDAMLKPSSFPATKNTRELPLVAGVFANNSRFDGVTELEKMVACPKNVKAVLDNYGFKTNDMLLINFVK